MSCEVDRARVEFDRARVERSEMRRQIRQLEPGENPGEALSDLYTELHRLEAQLEARSGHACYARRCDHTAKERRKTYQSARIKDKIRSVREEIITLQFADCSDQERKELVRYIRNRNEIEQAYYDARYRFLAACECAYGNNQAYLTRKLQCMKVAGLNMYKVHDVWFYEELTASGTVRAINLLFGGGWHSLAGREVPDGVGHGHCTLKVSRDGSLYVDYFRAPERR